MVEFAPFDPKWYRDLKESRKDFYDVSNIIESAKFKYDRELNMPKWIIGIGITAFLGAGYNLKGLAIQPNLMGWVIGFLIASAIFLMLGLGILTKLAKVQQIAMAYLYREKDKQDRENNTLKKK